MRRWTTIAIAVSFAVYAAAVLASPYEVDDAINKDVRSYAAAHGQNLLGVIGHFNGQWIENERRFFPASFAWTYSVFWVFGTRLEYKLALVALVAIAILLIACVAHALTRSRLLASLAALAGIAALQLRSYSDGLDTYAGLLPLTFSLTMAALLICLKGRGVITAVGAGALYLLAIFTYESVVLFAPALIAIVIWKMSWRRAGGIAAAALIEVAIAIGLRATGPGSNAPAYTIALAPDKVAATFVRQASAALPGSQWWLHSASTPAVALLLILMCLVVIGIPVLLAAFLLVRALPPMPLSGPLMLTAFGAWIWLSSSGLIAITERWQNELPRGQGYIAVVYGYFGIAMIATGGIALLTQWARQSSRPWVATGCALACSTALAVVCSFAGAGNLTITG